MSRKDLALTADLARRLRGVVFPATKEDLIRHARDNRAGDDIIRVLEELEDREYERLADVMKSYSKAA
jgi:Mg/Co/Ni transporter MgtE